jgi:hypothetical protein
MYLELKIDTKSYNVNLNNPIPIHIGISRHNQVSAYGLPKATFSTVVDGSFIGDVSKGGSCNVENLQISPHGNGTHTEGVGHVHTNHQSILSNYKKYFYLAQLISVEPNQNNQLEASSFTNVLTNEVEAIVVRTIPNNPDKLIADYANFSAPFFSKDCISFFNSYESLKHIITDLPSLDKSEDSNLTAHKLWFLNPKDQSPILDKFITELVFVPNHIPDGLYLASISPMPAETDATPSSVILYELVS